VNPVETAKANSYFGGIFNKIPFQSMSSISKMIPSNALELFPSFAKDVKVFQIEPYQLKPGQKAVISGTGFAESDNIFSFGSYKTSTINCQYSTTCEVTVPENASNGEVEVSLENSRGNSRNQGFSAKAYITNNPTSASYISSVAPNFVNASDLNVEFILKGERFSSSDNYIYTPLGKVGPYGSSDGKTLIFSIKNMTDIAKLVERGRVLKTDNIPLPLRVGNQYGVSDVIFINLYVNK